MLDYVNSLLVQSTLYTVRDGMAGVTIQFHAACNRHVFLNTLINAGLTIRQMTPDSYSITDTVDSAHYTDGR